ncbi:MAG: BNR-4 repeat-containing protein [Planctomycetota bacterium]|jgi:hypothetical protein
MKTKVKIAAVLMAVSCFVPGLVRDCSGASDTDSAFAMIGAKMSVGNFHLYPPFYNNVIAPHAVVAADKVFCAFQNTYGWPIIMAYDIAQKKWSEPVAASDDGLGKDAHGNPSICLDRNGYIHIFYGCHGRTMRHTRSMQPYDIASWQEHSEPTQRATYPQSIRMADDSICLFYRAGGHMAPWTLQTSSDDGATWSPGEKVIEMQLEPQDPLAAAYAAIVPGTHGRTIHCFWVHKDDNAARVRGDKKHPWRPLRYKGLHEAVYRYNQYYIRRDADGLWRNITGRQVKLPVTKAYADEHCLVFDSGDKFTNIARPIVDAYDRPYAVFKYGVGDWKKGGATVVPWSLKYADFNSDTWHIADGVPNTWPAAVEPVARAQGPAAFGDKSHGNWFMWYERTTRGSQPGSYIFLRHEKDGFITRAGGPARLP